MPTQVINWGHGEVINWDHGCQSVLGFFLSPTAQIHSFRCEVVISFLLSILSNPLFRFANPPPPPPPKKSAATTRIQTSLGEPHTNTTHTYTHKHTTHINTHKHTTHINTHKYTHTDTHTPTHTETQQYQRTGSGARGRGPRAWTSGWPTWCRI